MFSVQPIPGNPWPHGMIITIEDSLQSLVDLLWIREAWGLGEWGTEYPPPLTDTPPAVGSVDRLRVAEWRYAWPDVWDVCLAHAAEVRDPSLFDQIKSAPVGSAERAAVLEKITGPSWRDRFGNSAFTAEYGTWQASQDEILMLQHGVPVLETPERRSLDALVEAWHSGLTKIVEIPCRGTFTRRIGPSSLLLTHETRHDPRRFSKALQDFRRT